MPTTSAGAHGRGSRSRRRCSLGRSLVCSLALVLGLAANICRSTKGATPSAASGDQSATAATRIGEHGLHPRAALCAQQQSDHEPAAERMIRHPEQLRGHGGILVAVRPPFQVLRDVPLSEETRHMQTDCR